MASLDQQIAEVKRELALRKNVYPKFVSAGKMRQAEADLSTERMTAALHSLMAVKRLRATMMEHQPTGSGGCTCGQWRAADGAMMDVWYPAWLDHVFERSKAAAEAEPPSNWKDK